jgi:hypothetical protein
MKKVDQIRMTWAFKTKWDLEVRVPASGNRKESVLEELKIVSSDTSRMHKVTLRGQEPDRFVSYLETEKFLTPALLFPEVRISQDQYFWKIEGNVSFTVSALMIARAILGRLEVQCGSRTFDQLVASFQIEKHPFVWFQKRWERYDDYVRLEQNLPAPSPKHLSLPRQHQVAMKA